MAKTVLITGASSGIGEATAKYFIKQGWNVAATMRSRSGSAGASPHKAGDWTQAGNVIVPSLDVTDESTIASAIEQTVARFGAIDVLVNNAGYGLTGPLEGISSLALRQQFDTNVFGLVTVIQNVLPIMRRQRYGTIVCQRLIHWWADGVSFCKCLSCDQICS